MNHRSKFPEAVQSPNPVESYQKMVTGNQNDLGIGNRYFPRNTKDLPLQPTPRLPKLPFYLGRKYIYILFLYIYTRIREAFFSFSRALNTQKQKGNQVTGAFLEANLLFSKVFLGYLKILVKVTKKVTGPKGDLEVAHV